MEIEYCKVCGDFTNTEEHHITKRKQATFLINCKMNKINLCPNCHRGTNGVHGKNGHGLDQRLKLEFQNKLEMIFDKHYFTMEEIGKALNINYKASYSLCKLIKQNKGVFDREEIIRVCMGGEMIESEVLNDNS